MAACSRILHSCVLSLCLYVCFILLNAGAVRAADDMPAFTSVASLSAQTKAQDGMTASAAGNPVLSADADPSVKALNTVSEFLGVPGLASPADSSQAGTAATAENPAAATESWQETEPVLQNISRPESGRYSSTGFENADMQEMVLQRGLSYGMNLVNSAGENAVTSLTDDGRARFNFQFDPDGRLSGEADVLLPLYDSPRHTFFTQLGTRSMEVSGGRKDGSQRWIGNFGFGQRYFPYASSMEEAGDLMLGWNAFYDYDFTRAHRRGGLGVETQYDWLHLAANYYFPLSGWKASYDFDGSLLEERPARGWDVRARAYLPFYRAVALTASYSQWYGDNVAMFGSVNDLEKDPRVWSYGLEYTPFPMLSASVRQSSTERGRTDTQFGLQFTYRFGVPLQEQLRSSVSSGTGSVSSARHEFVDRENRIILEYRLKNAGAITYLGPVPGKVNTFAFSIADGFGNPWSQKNVSVAAGGVTLALNSEPAFSARSLLAGIGQALSSLLGIREAYAADGIMNYVTDNQGRFEVQVNSTFAGPVTLRVRAGEREQSFTVNVIANVDEFRLQARPDSLLQYQPQEVTFILTNHDEPVPEGTAVSYVISGLGGDADSLTGDGTTDSAGAFKVSNVVTNLTSDADVTVKVNEAEVETSMQVTQAEFAVELTEGSLQQLLPSDLTFKLTNQGQTAPAGIPVHYQLSGVSEGQGEAEGDVSTDSQGQFVLEDVVSAGTELSVQFTVNEQEVPAVSLDVAAADYALSLSPAQIVQYQSSDLTFTLTNAGQPVPAGTQVTYRISGQAEAGGDLQQAETDEHGQFTVTGVVMEQAGEAQVTVTVHDKEVSATLQVTAASYELTAAPAALTQYEEQKVTFSITRNNEALQKTQVTLSCSEPVFSDSQTTYTDTTDEQGRLQVTVTAQSAGTLTVSARAEGAEIDSIDLTVSKAQYALEASPAKLTQLQPAEVVFTLIRNGSPLPDTAVSFTSTDAFSGLPEGSVTTDGNGRITVQALTALESGSLSISVTAEGQDLQSSFSVAQARYDLEIASAGEGGDFTSACYQTITLTATLQLNGKQVELQDGEVTWQVISSQVSSKAWSRSAGAYNGLSWGITPVSGTIFDGEKNQPDGTAATGAVASLTDIVGERTVTVEARVNRNGQTVASGQKQVSFGKGPLSVFAGKPKEGTMSWDEAAKACGGTPGNPNVQAYQPQTKLPTKEQLLAVAANPLGEYGEGKYGAAYAAGWPTSFNFWLTGEKSYYTGDFVLVVELSGGAPNAGPKGRTVCLP